MAQQFFTFANRKQVLTVLKECYVQVKYYCDTFLYFLLEDPDRCSTLKNRKHTLSIGRKTQIIAAHKKALKS